MVNPHPHLSIGDDFLKELRGHRSDRLLLLILLITISCSWFWLQHQLNSREPVLYIYHQQTLLAYYPLMDSREKTIQIQGELGNISLQINASGAHITHSNCSRKACMQQHIIHPGEMIACVPNEIFMIIRGSNEEIQWDGIAQ
ncbi:MAG: NusG domain II-containing protein [Zetaproteobacteria bacterium]|nr:NusG domain II-containing protein [Zetaproteobacteria bacterium]